MAKTVKRVVRHPNLYLRVEGKLQRMKVGTELTLTEKQCKDLGDKVSDPSQRERVDTTTKDGQRIEGGVTESEAVKEMTEQLAASQAETETAKAETEKVKAEATEALTKQQTDLNTSQAETETAKAETATANTALSETATKLAASVEAVKVLTAEVKKLKK